MSELHPDRLRWNAKYQARGTPPLGAPNPWLQAQESLLQSQAKGPALDIACGTGKNSCYLAQLGFVVDALDIADVAIESLSQHPLTHRGQIHAAQHNLETEALPPRQYQVILNFFYLQRNLFPQLITVLAPGGLLIFETFCQTQPVNPSINPRFLLQPGELQEVFHGTLKIQQYAEIILPAHTSHPGRKVARMVAQKNTDN